MLGVQAEIVTILHVVRPTKENVCTCGELGFSPHPTEAAAPEAGSEWGSGKPLPGEGRALRFLGQDVHRGPLPSHQGLLRPGHVPVCPRSAPSLTETSRVQAQWAGLGILQDFTGRGAGLGLQGALLP